MIQRLHEGQCLTRRDIAALYGGNARAFLPRIDGDVIVAGCFDPEMNPRAPHEVLVHDSPNAILAARRFLEQTSPGSAEGGRVSALPIFLRRAPNVWEYIGRFRAAGYTEDPHELAVRIYEIRPHRYERHVRQYGEMRGILFLEAAD